MRARWCVTHECSALTDALTDVCWLADWQRTAGGNPDACQIVWAVVEEEGS